MANWKVFIVLVIVLLSAAALQASIQNPSQNTLVHFASSYTSQEITSTVYLPIVMREYDPSYIPPFGIVMYGDVNDASGLQKMKEAGSKWVTTILNWAAIEPSKGTYDWSSFDIKAQNAQAAGMDVFVLFTGNPSWAASLPGGPVTDTQDLVNFVILMAERYDCDGLNDAPGSPCVHYWSFYAEPDNGDIGRAYGGKGYWGHNGAGFAAMLQKISPAIHAVNPKAKVLIGGLAYDWFEEEGGPFVRSFLTDTLQALNKYPGGARAYIDAVAFHFYPISPGRWPTIREKALEVRGIMERHGVGDLPLICPEMGYWSATSAGSNESFQARRLVQIYIQGLSVGLEHLSWFAVFDGGPGTEEHGLFWDHDLTRPKQSYYAYKTLAQELNRARYLRRLQVKDVEGYVFRMPGGREKTVLWATTSSATVSFPYSCLRLVDTLGNIYIPINDGDRNWDWDQTMNGQIVLGVYQDTPFYVEPCP
jgi:hypothetical protein